MKGHRFSGKNQYPHSEYLYGKKTVVMAYRLFQSNLIDNAYKMKQTLFAP